MEITKTLLINAACLLIPPVVVVLLLRHFFPRKIRWSAGVVALVDLVIFWTDISYNAYRLNTASHNILRKSDLLDR